MCLLLHGQVQDYQVDMLLKAVLPPGHHGLSCVGTRNQVQKVVLMQRMPSTFVLQWESG